MHYALHYNVEVASVVLDACITRCRWRNECSVHYDYQFLEDDNDSSDENDK